VAPKELKRFNQLRAVTISAKVSKGYTLGDGLHGEFGAMRIPKKHDVTLHYVDELCLRKRPFIGGNDAAYYFARGCRERKRDVQKISQVYRLEASEKGKRPDELWDLAVGSQLPLLTPAQKQELGTSNTFESDALRCLDRLSLRRVAELARLSEEAIEYLFSLFGVGTLQHSGLTEHLREELEEIWLHEFYEIVGGTDLLPAAFSSKLRSKPKMGHEVVSLQQMEDCAEAIYRTRNASTPHREKGDFLLCTIPLPVLARLDVNPAFSGEKQRAIRDVYYESGTKVLVPTTERFWETDDGIYGGSSVTDLMTGPIFYPSDNAKVTGERTTGPSQAAKSRQPGVLVASYTWGQDARRLGNMPASQREALTIDLVSKVHPQLKRFVRQDGAKSWAWDNHPWAGGAFAFYMPSQFAALHRHVVAPEGRIFFAGEHCSRSHSWMQGALQSAREAVDAMVARAC
jgi:monoamine oxidase